MNRRQFIKDTVMISGGAKPETLFTKTKLNTEIRRSMEWIFRLRIKYLRQNGISNDFPDFP